MNPMRQIRIEKITLNIGTGSPGDNLEKAVKLLQKISSSKPVETKAKKRIPTWNLRPGLSIGTKVTLRGKKAEALLKRLIKAASNVIPAKKFDKFGNLSFGIAEYIDIPEVDYDHDIGIIGLEVAVTLSRPGFSIKHRNRQIGKKHLITKQEAIEFMKKNYNIKLEA